ncbi:tetratricopeptide repeat protein [Sphingomonas xanthus]|uniref:Tetratricopeptide repeat protein n=1 Tax=Sphingomonas xanthus TaxID=2594473 RepID=A0A516IP55_9SPHN|nr:tetratricopeptide repeat protein [Sphingomonas xanthus]QDP18564.1 tetratricopeptide repeat protein [Sphingomonas xanthus]
MKLTPNKLAMLLAAGSVFVAAPAVAQTAESAKASPQAAGYQPKVSSGARKEIVALQTAVNANDTANIAALAQAAKAKAKTKDDQYLIAQLQLKAAIAAKNEAAMAEQLQTLVGLDVLPASDANSLRVSLGKIHYNAKAYDQAAAALEPVIQANPDNVDAITTLAEVRSSQGKGAEAVALVQKAIALKKAAGQKPDENWYKRAVQLSFNANSPSTPAMAREWVAAYPSATNWRDAIRIYQTTSKLDDAALIDTMRLSRATGSLKGENDYFRFANTLVVKGYAGEAKAVLDEGFASKAIDKSSQTFSQLYTLATSRSQGDRASLGASAAKAKAAASARASMTTGDAYYGYGDYQQAVDMYRNALTKSDVDKDVANLRLGMALARSGDKAGATAALNAVGGSQAEIAKLWLAYIAAGA